MNNSKKHRPQRKLELKKNTVVHLTSDRLKNVVGAGDQTISSFPIRSCETQCDANAAA